jgi:Cu/Ag efflux protein CusF
MRANPRSLSLEISILTQSAALTLLRHVCFNRLRQYSNKHVGRAASTVLPEGKGGMIMRFVSKAAFLVLLVGIMGCGSSEQPKTSSPAVSSAQPASQPTADSTPKTYHLEGTIVSINRQQKRLIVDGKDIPGFMAAMTMPYPVADDQTLNRVKPGDEITADVVAKDSDYHLDNVVVVKTAGPKK